MSTSILHDPKFCPIISRSIQISELARKKMTTFRGLRAEGPVFNLKRERAADSLVSGSGFRFRVQGLGFIGLRV